MRTYITTLPALSTGLVLLAVTSLFGCSQPAETKSNNQNNTDSAMDSSTATTADPDANIDVKAEDARQDATILRFSHFMPATDPINKQVFEPWAKKIEAQSNGRLQIEIYPSATLSKPGATYDAAAKGTVDIGMQAFGYTAGRWPLSQISELPGISNSAAQQSCMIHKLYDDGVISDEYKDSHLLYVMGTGPGALHTVDKVIKVPSDMKGLRIRQPSAVASHVIETVGAAPVGMPAPDTYMAIDRGVIDGMSFSWQPFGAFRLTELMHAHTNIPFYSAALVVNMNKDKYDSLPADLQKVIDDNSGAQMAAVAAKVFDAENTAVMEEARANGDIMIDIPDPLNDPDWKGPLLEGSQRYLDEVSAKGLDAQHVYEQALAAAKVCAQ